jgi:hypothetical protein
MRNSPGPTFTTEGLRELAEAVAPELRRHGSRELFRRLAREQHNLRAAMSWALEHHEPELCVRLAVALEEFWPQEAPLDGARWLTTGLEAAGERLPAPLLARALATLADRLSVPGRRSTNASSSST